MKDFAKSIVCNTKAENIATDITTDGNTWFVTTSDGKKKEFPSEREAEEYVKKIKAGNKKAGNSKVGNGLDQQEAREFQQSLKPIKSLIEDAGAAAYSSPKEAVAYLQRAKQEIEKAIQWLK